MTNDHRPTRSRAPTRGRWRTQDKVTLSLAFLHFHFRNIFGNKLAMGCYFYLQPSSHTGEMAHSGQSYLKFGFSTLSLSQYFWKQVDHGLLLLLAAELTHGGDGTLKTKILEVWHLFTFFAISWGRVDRWLLSSS